MDSEQMFDGECGLRARIGLSIDSSEVIVHRMCVLDLERDIIPLRSGISRPRRLWSPASTAG